MSDPASSFDASYHAYYTAVYRDDEATRQRLLAFYARVLGPELPHDLSSPILDLGCGSGHALRFLRSRGHTQLHGIDINPAQVAAAVADGLAVEHAAVTRDWLHAHPARFDLILATDVLEHVPVAELADLLAAIRGALAPGGRLVCTVPNASSTIGLHWRHIDLTHHTAFTTSSLQLALAAAGFTDLRLRGSAVFRREDTTATPARRILERTLQLVTRAWRRAELIGELGLDEALAIPLDVNLLAAARVPRGTPPPPAAPSP